MGPREERVSVVLQQARSEANVALQVIGYGRAQASAPLPPTGAAAKFLNHRWKPGLSGWRARRWSWSVRYMLDLQRWLSEHGINHNLRCRLTAV